MTNEAILQKAIDKAQFIIKVLNFVPFEKLDIQVINCRVFWSLKLKENDSKALIQSSTYGVIFDQDFAKAFWGKEWQEGDQVKQSIEEIFNPMPPRWQHHLQQMVLEEDPIKYLEQFLDCA